MLKYIIKRTLWVIPTLLGVLIILFSLTYLMPGDPASVMLGPRATPELVAEINQRMHFDRAMPVRGWAITCWGLPGGTWARAIRSAR